MKYDYLIVGCGLFGATFAEQMMKNGKSVLMIDKRPHIGGNVYTESTEGINVHKYGAHIFHTSNEAVWNYIRQFATFNHYVNRPKVNYKGKYYSFPINLMTLYQMWGVTTPVEAEAKLASVRVPIEHPQNLEEWILSQVGEEIYETFIKGYTTKQWGRQPSELPTFIIRRLPIRLTFDDNYFNDPYQGIPIGGYTPIIEAMTKGADIHLGVDFFADQAAWEAKADKVVFTGKIDEYYDYRFGELEYRTLRFDTKVLDMPDYQGNAVINYTDEDTPYTRILEHKHFEFEQGPKTVVTWEYPDAWDRSKVPYYPVNDKRNMELYHQYDALKVDSAHVIFGGRLAEYRYYDMHQVIASALATAQKEFNS